MIHFFKQNIEPKKGLRIFETTFSILLCIVSIVSIGYGAIEINSHVDEIQFVQTIEMVIRN